MCPHYFQLYFRKDRWSFKNKLKAYKLITWTTEEVYHLTFSALHFFPRLSNECSPNTISQTYFYPFYFVLQIALSVYVRFNISYLKKIKKTASVSYSYPQFHICSVESQFGIKLSFSSGTFCFSFADHKAMVKLKLSRARDFSLLVIHETRLQLAGTVSGHVW